MLLQYLYDFDRELERGHNLIEEKYGRMMESTAPGQYEEMKARFPEITPEKKEIIERIVAMQVAWMEEFAADYPYLAGNARSIHTYEDKGWDTSYETYLRGDQHLFRQDAGALWQIYSGPRGGGTEPCP